ncbi:redoxin domain-containing protein [uncultured Tenacibaculum sp.]|uniref:TlpA family protein disulfide reductase n=1 Tax=uncultured Tenacibaculum sp. TaxID=174713 RepID=UPI00260A2BE9|nr:redoxin domain-containing protein [uncultured Tenacibaculum sp.]
MKKTLLIIISIIAFASCSKSNKEILKEVSTNLSNIKTIKYTSSVEFKDKGKLIFKDLDTISFDFRIDKSNNLKYHFNSLKGEVIFNGNKTMQSHHKEKITTINNDISNESVNNPLILTISSLKQLLPKIIRNDSISITRKNDTIINNNKYLVFNFFLKNKYIDWVNYGFKENDNNDSEYYLIVNNSSYFPYKIISQNGKTGFISRTIENITLNYKFDNKLWTGENLPKDYPVFTVEEYLTLRKNSMLNNVGKQITNWELPELNSNSTVNLSKLKGNVVLLEFWFKGCVACLKAIPSLNKIKKRFEKNDFKIYGIEYLQDYSKKELENYLTEYKVEFPSLYNGKKMALTYGIQRAPTFMILDKDGEIIAIKNGFSEKNINDIVSFIKKNI